MIVFLGCDIKNDRHHRDGDMTGLKTRIETPLLTQSVGFYTEYLEMTVLESWDGENDAGAILGLGSSIQGEAFLELARSEIPRDYSGLSLQFRVRDVAAFADRLRPHLAFRGPVPRPWGSKYLYLQDPSGIQIILYEGKL